MIARVATVAGSGIPVDEVDAREAAIRAGPLAATLPVPGTSEGRQLRRWLVQLVVAERVVAVEAAGLAVITDAVPSVDAILPDTAARLEIGSVAAAVLAGPLARALYCHVTAAVDVSADEVADYHARNPLRFASTASSQNGWKPGVAEAPPLAEVSAAVTDLLRAAARRRAFRRWLDSRVAALADLAPGYEHPGDPRQPDNTHRH